MSALPAAAPPAAARALYRAGVLPAQPELRQRFRAIAVSKAPLLNRSTIRTALSATRFFLALAPNTALSGGGMHNLLNISAELKYPE